MRNWDRVYHRDSASPGKVLKKNEAILYPSVQIIQPQQDPHHTDFLGVGWGAENRLKKTDIINKLLSEWIINLFQISFMI